MATRRRDAAARGALVLRGPRTCGENHHVEAAWAKVLEKRDIQQTCLSRFYVYLYGIPMSIVYQLQKSICRLGA